MRKLALILNGITVVFFACFLAYTFFAREHLDRLARDFVTSKTEPYAAAAVSIADQMLANKALQLLLTKDQLEQWRSEIAQYRENPKGYIGSLTGQIAAAEEPIPKNPLIAKAREWKRKVRDYYDKVLRELIVDLRIFSCTNLVAGAVGLGLVYSARVEIQRAVLWISILLFMSVVACSTIYVDDLSFFQILFGSRMGWWYPVLLIGTWIGLYQKYGAHHEDAKTGG